MYKTAKKIEENNVIMYNNNNMIPKIFKQKYARPLLKIYTGIKENLNKISIFMDFKTKELTKSFNVTSFFFKKSKLQ